MLWEQRALFDIHHNSISKVQPAPQLFIKCSYCHENISTKGKRNKTTERQGANNTQVSNLVSKLPFLLKLS